MKKYKDYIKEDGDLDEEKLFSDFSAIIVPLAINEEVIQKITGSLNKEREFDLLMEYYTKRKEIAKEYVKKIKEGEEN